MATERDMIEAKQNRWRRYMEQLKAELQQAEEIIRVLELAKGEPGRALPTTTTPTIERVRAASPAPVQNRGMTELIRTYIRDHVAENEKIDTPALARWLIEHGMKGSYRNVYNACAVALRKEADHHRGIAYEKGAGFFKPVREDGSKAALIPGLVG